MQGSKDFWRCVSEKGKDPSYQRSHGHCLYTCTRPDTNPYVKPNAAAPPARWQLVKQWVRQPTHVTPHMDYLDFGTSEGYGVYLHKHENSYHRSCYSNLRNTDLMHLSCRAAA